jgi:hypothetical protein
MKPLLFLASLLLSLAGIAVGLFLARRPKRVIELQQASYLKLNWKIEPVSLSKELRNTRRIGIFLLILSAATLTYSLARRIFVFLP